MSSHGETMDVTVSRPDALAAGGTTDARGSRDRRRLALVAAVAGGVSAVVSVTGSWIPSLWGDEAASLLSAERPLATLPQMIGHVDAVHATYYVLLHEWIRIAGTSAFAIRLPSALAVGAAAAAVVVVVVVVAVVVVAPSPAKVTVPAS